MRVFITGGASGLGRELALHCARASYRVCISDLNRERGEQTATLLREVGAVDVAFFQADVRSEADFEEIREYLIKYWDGVDVVVNNAGVAQVGKIEDVPLEDWEWVVDINLLGVVRGCRVFTPLLKRQRSGHLINIASMAGLLEGPEMAAYCVTKAGVVKLSEVLQSELADWGVKVSVVCPSFFPTNLAESLRSTTPGTDKRMQRVFARSPLTAEEVAGEIFKAMQRPRFWVLPHQREKYLWWLKGLLPQVAYTRLAAWLIKKADPARR